MRYFLQSVINSHPMDGSSKSVPPSNTNNCESLDSSSRGDLDRRELAGRGRWLHAARANEINKAHHHGVALHRQTAVVSRATAQSTWPKQRFSPSNQTPSRVAAGRSNHRVLFTRPADWCDHVEVMYSVPGCMSIANECDAAGLLAYASPGRMYAGPHYWPTSSDVYQNTAHLCLLHPACA